MKFDTISIEILDFELNFRQIFDHQIFFSTDHSAAGGLLGSVTEEDVVEGAATWKKNNWINFDGKI